MCLASTLSEARRARAAAVDGRLTRPMVRKAADRTRIAVTRLGARRARPVARSPVAAGESPPVPPDQRSRPSTALRWSVRDSASAASQAKNDHDQARPDHPRSHGASFARGLSEGKPLVAFTLLTLIPRECQRADGTRADVVECSALQCTSFLALAVEGAGGCNAPKCLRNIATPRLSWRPGGPRTLGQRRSSALETGGLRQPSDLREAFDP
jgi:hypothetical protein